MTDAELIELHGGSTKLAKKMGLTGKWVVQRVHNWKTRGIPANVKLKYPGLFLAQEVLITEVSGVARHAPHSGAEPAHG